MKKLKLIILSLLVAVSATNCFEDQDDNLITASEINDFVWKGMNLFYVYKDEIPDLANDRFATNEDYADYLNSFSAPEDLFESLIYLPNDVDEYSVIVPNYFELEQFLQGTSLSNGMAFGLRLVPNSSTDVFGYVSYVMPNTSAETQGVMRGMIFNSIDGTPLTTSNFSQLISQTTYSIDLANYNNNGTPETSDDTLNSTNESITLTKEAYTENPILVNSIIEQSGSKIGYLMYNGFRFEDGPVTQLNNAFANFNSENIDALVLDLRYNGGGSVSTTIWLASMITGQFTGQLMFEENWNSEIQALFESENPALLVNNFVDTIVKRNTSGDVTFQQTINSLGLTKLYVLTTGRSASASELLINSLRPYIDVVQIGTNTEGKPQASRTVYDSENFSRDGANPNHTYAMQPLIYESANADGFSSYYDGLAPTTGFELAEDYGNLGTLGNVNEPLLARAIADITGVGRVFSSPTVDELKFIADDQYDNPFALEMIDNRSSKQIIK